MKPLYILLFLLTGLCALGQKTSSGEIDVHARLLTGKKRSLIAYAGEYHSFTLEVPPRGAKPSDVPGFITPVPTVSVRCC